MRSSNENNDEFSKRVHGKTNMKKVLKVSYNLLKVNHIPSSSKSNVENENNKKEKKGIRLKTSMKAYLEVTRQGFEKLSWSSTTKYNKQKITIKENMQTINDSCLEEQQPTINRLPKFNKVNFVAAVGQVPQINHNNVDTKETLEQVQEMHQLIKLLQDMLEQERGNLFEPAKNLLFIHTQLFQLELSRDNTMQEARTVSQDVIGKLRGYFSQLDKFSHHFTNYLFELSSILIPLAKSGQASTTIASIGKIIEKEEAEDERSLFKVHEINHLENQRDSSLETGKNIARTIKSYKSKFKEQVHSSIGETFKVTLQKCGELPLQLLLDQLDFIYNDLKLVKNEIVPHFPSHYKLLLLFVLEYHRNVYTCMEEVLHNDLDAGSILILIRWVRHYYTFMDKEMQQSEDMLEPTLLGEREQELMDECLKMMRSKFQEWKTNLIENDINEFTKRQDRPELGSNNLAGLPGIPVLINMVRQQIDVATEFATYQLLTEVINYCCEIMTEVQSIWISVMKSEFQRHLDNQDISPEGLVIYIVALANGQIDFSNFLKQFKSSLPEEYIKNVTEVLNNVMNGFLNVATNAINTISDIVYNDLKNPFREMHTTKWYERDPMAVIILTLKDYMEECHSYLNPEVFHQLIIRILGQFVIAYIESMRNRTVKFRMPYCLDKMKQDICSVSEFFGQYIEARELNSQLDVIYKLHNFLGTSKELVYLDYYTLRKAYGDCPRKYLKIILSKRDDLNLFAVKKINKILKDKAAEAGEYTGEPTVFSKIIIKDLEGNARDELKGEFHEVFHNMKLRSVKKII
ncbi:11219_t:CDS:2 [Funneliformis geosporum]|uniref:14193_t:CDS:1 n=1 Tax=Funneliformis geosporum TaxID=1117311 RepID=A0A9W4SSA7_9GLOM|nr:11219_t:CDS:2 [Funneliformis geosporum]CAI2178731.1 14193_t:CDS:2 [Funneliformis geosporum]